MARFPGTERQHNRSGFAPGQVVRFRRSRANGELGLADRRGFVSEVRPGHVRVMLDADGGSQWIESQAVLPEEGVEDAALERLRRAFTAVDGLRLEIDEHEWTFFTEGFREPALADLHAALDDRLEHLELTCFGVHEMALRMRLAPAPPAPPPATT